MIFMSMMFFSKRPALSWSAVLLASVLMAGCAPSSTEDATDVSVGVPSSIAEAGSSPTAAHTNATTTTTATTTTVIPDLRREECDREEPVSLPADISEVAWDWEGPPLSGKVLATNVDEDLTRIVIIDLGEQTMTTYTYQPSFLYSDLEYYQEDISLTPGGDVIAISGQDCFVYLFSDLGSAPAEFPVDWRYPHAFTNQDGTRLWIVQRSGPSDTDSTLVNGFYVRNGRSFTSKELDEPYFTEAVVNNKLLMSTDNERIILENGLVNTLIRCNRFNLAVCPELAAVSERELIALAYYESIRLFFAGPGYKAGPEEYDYNINEIIVADLRTKEYLYTVPKPEPGSWKSVGPFRDGPIYTSDSLLAVFVPAEGDVWSLALINMGQESVEHLVTVDNQVLSSDFRETGGRVWLSGEGRVLYTGGSVISLLDPQDGSLRRVVSLPEGFRVRDVGAAGG